LLWYRSLAQAQPWQFGAPPPAMGWGASPAATGWGGGHVGLAF